MIGDPYEDRPASHAMHHAYGEGPACRCDGDPEGWHVTGAEAFWMFVVVLAVVAMVALS